MCRKELLDKPMGQSPQSCGRLSLVGLAQLFLSSCWSCGLLVRRLPPLAPILDQCPLNEERATKVLGENSGLRRLDLKRQAGSFKSGHFHPSMRDVKSIRKELVVKYSIPIIELPFAPASTTVMAVPVPAVV